ncbi:MAG: hypothetical protein FH758_04145 [Firmicutes bacterium]|nr:hypothetical protein [Bacillota bacterium]
MKLKAALYIRVSTEEQVENHSIPSQKERIEAFCKSQDWEIYDYFIDDGFSGKNLDRPAMQKLLSEAGEKKFDIVLIYRLDRFSRRALDVLRVVEEVFEPNQIFLKSATEPFDTSTIAGRMMLTMLVGFAQFERESIAERVKTNMLHKAAHGEWCGANQAPFGYKNMDKQLVIVQEEAAIVKEIFSMYASGNGLRTIAKNLNERGCRTRKGYMWSHTVIRNILVNPQYVGNMIWNRTERKGTKTIKRDKSEWIISKGNHDPIVDKKTFDAVQSILESRGKMSMREASSDYVLSGLVYCGQCGYKYRGWYKKAKKPGRKVRYYRCGGYNYYGISCKTPSIQTHELEEYVLQELEKLEQNESALWQAYKHFQERDLGKKETLTVALKETKQTLSSIGTRKQKWFDAFEQGALEANDLKERINQLNNEREKCEKRLVELEASMANIEAKEISIGHALESIKNVRQRWNSASVQEQKLLVRSIINKITIHSRENIEIEFYF